MKMVVTNKDIQVGDLKMNSIGITSVFLLGDSENITCYTYFDTPADSVIFDPRYPIRERNNVIDPEPLDALSLLTAKSTKRS